MQQNTQHFTTINDIATAITNKLENFCSAQQNEREKVKDVLSALARQSH